MGQRTRSSCRAQVEIAIENGQIQAASNSYVEKALNVLIPLVTSCMTKQVALMSSIVCGHPISRLRMPHAVCTWSWALLALLALAVGQLEDYDDDTFTLAMAGTTCLGLIAQVSPGAQSLCPACAVSVVYFVTPEPFAHVCRSHATTAFPWSANLWSLQFSRQTGTCETLQFLPSAPSWKARKMRACSPSSKEYVSALAVARLLGSVSWVCM